MPYNALGDLYKTEIVKRLQDLGCNIKNVHALNLILEEMGLLEHIGRNWLTTDAGVKFAIYRGRVFDADAWHPELVEAVFKFLKSKG